MRDRLQCTWTESFQLMLLFDIMSLSLIDSANKIIRTAFILSMGINSHQTASNPHESNDVTQSRIDGVECFALWCIWNFSMLCTNANIWTKNENRLTMHIFNTMLFRTFFPLELTSNRFRLLSQTKTNKIGRPREGEKNCCKIYAFHFTYRLCVLWTAQRRDWILLCAMHHIDIHCVLGPMQKHHVHTHTHENSLHTFYVCYIMLHAFRTTTTAEITIIKLRFAFQ